jgi:hypothetical protein
MTGVSTHAFTGAGTASIPLPPGAAGDGMMLFVSVDSTTTPTAPTGWALESSFRFVAPIWRSYSRTRGSGDTSVSLTVAGAATAVVVDFGVTPPNDPLASATPGDEGPTTLSVVNNTPVSGDPVIEQAIVIAWHEDGGYIDTAGDFTEYATVSVTGQTQSVYVISGMVDVTTYTITLEEPGGIIRRADLYPWGVLATGMKVGFLRMTPT